MVSSPSQGGVYAVSAVLIVASLVAVVLRFRARHVKDARLQADDWLALISMFLGWGLAFVLIAGAARGTLGTHTSVNPKTGKAIVTWHEPDTSMLAGISQLLTIIVLGTLKSSVVTLYRRIFIGSHFQMFSLVVLVTIVLWTVAFFFATLFECGSDFDRLWLNQMTFATFCGKYKYIQLGHAASDVATDLIVLSMPLPVIWTLHMNGTRKAALSFIFLLGLLSTAAGVARLVIVAENIYETVTGSRDVRGVETNAMVWSFVEVGVGVVAACLPTLKPIIDRRTPESIVNSVRSRLSLGSRGSGSKASNTKASSKPASKLNSKLHLQDNASESSSHPDGGFELHAVSRLHGDAHPTVTNQIQSGNNSGGHAYSGHGILRENDVAFQEERMGRAV